MPLIPALERWRETGRDMAGHKEEYKAKRKQELRYSLRFGGDSCILKMQSEDAI